MKKILSLVLIVVMCAALALTTGCSDTADTGSKDTSSITIENIYGSSDLTEEQIAAFQNSGEIKLYTTEADLAKGKYDEKAQAEHDFYKKYYGLTVKYKYQAYGDDLTKFMVDFANGDAPDMISLNYRRWPKAGNRQIVYSVSELEEMGIVGLDHPQMEQYKDLQQPFYIDGECYSPIAYFCNPVMVGVNLDLFDKYKVKSPVEYYKEGNWNMDTFIQCCKELTRTNQDGTKVWGVAGWNYSWYLVANDARLVQWEGDKLVLTMNDPATLDTLDMWRNLNLNGYSPSAQESADTKPFETGMMGMKLYTATNLAKESFSQVTFNWDIVPMPYGSNNTSGMLPGEVSGTGIVTSSKNPQGMINYMIANRLWNDAQFGVDNSLYYLDTYVGIYNDEQVELIQSYCDKVDQDIYMGVGNINAIQWKFWDDVKAGTMTIKECIDTYEPVWKEQVDAENKMAVRK